MCMLARFLESKASRDIVAHAFAYTKEPQIKPPRNHQVTTNDPPVKHSGTTVAIFAQGLSSRHFAAEVGIFITNE